MSKCCEGTAIEFVPVFVWVYSPSPLLSFHFLKACHVNSILGLEVLELNDVFLH